MKTESPQNSQKDTFSEDYAAHRLLWCGCQVELESHKRHVGFLWFEVVCAIHDVSSQL